MSRAVNDEIKTFSVGFPVAAYNELPHARIVADQYKTTHKEFVVEPNALEVLPLLVRHYGEPYADSSALPSYYLAKMTRQHVTVALNGDGGDECFGGYERQLANALAERMGWVPRPLLKGLMSFMPDSVDPKNRWRRLKRFLSVASQSPLERYRHWLGIFPSITEGLDPIDQAIAIDTAFYLTNDLMVKMDIASMANSLEVRSPLLDYRLIEYCASLPGPMKIRRKRLKHLLKEVMSEHLPPNILNRAKQGFGVPLGQWFRGDLEPFVREL
jgi:asparagine synthase (glutamine-hydrolysing)